MSVASTSILPPGLALFGDKLLVIRGGKQRIQLVRIFQRYFDDPGGVRVLIDLLRSRGQFAIYLCHRAAGGREQVGYRLNRLHGTEGLASGELCADFRQLYEYDIPQRFLGMVRDSDSCTGAVGVDPLVFLGVFVVGWVIHRSPNLFWAVYKTVSEPPGP